MDGIQKDIFNLSFPDRYARVAHWVRQARLDLSYIDRQLSDIPAESPSPSYKPEWDHSGGFDEQAYKRHGLESSRYEIPVILKDRITEIAKYEPEAVRQAMLENADYLIDIKNTHVDKRLEDQKTLDEVGEGQVYNAKIKKDRQAWAGYDLDDKKANKGNANRISSRLNSYFDNQLDIVDQVNDPELRGVDRLKNPLLYEEFNNVTDPMPEKNDFGLNLNFATNIFDFALKFCTAFQVFR